MRVSHARTAKPAFYVAVTVALAVGAAGGAAGIAAAAPSDGPTFFVVSNFETVEAVDAESGDTDTFLEDSDLANLDGIAVDENTLYATDSTWEDKIVAVDIDSGEVDTVTDEGLADPRGIAVVDDTLYVTDYLRSEVVAVDIDSGETEPFVDDHIHHPTGIATDGEALYVANWEDGADIAVVDIDSQEVTTIDDTGEGNPSDLAIDGSTLYVANWISDGLKAIDLDSGEVDSLTTDVRHTNGIAVVDGTAYISAQDDDDIVAVDTDSGDVTEFADVEVPGVIAVYGIPEDSSPSAPFGGSLASLGNLPGSGSFAPDNGA